VLLYHASRVSANQKFSAVFLRMNTGWSTITSLRRVAFIGMSHAPKVLEEEHRRGLDYLISEGCMKEMVDAADLEGTTILLGSSLTELVLQNASGSLDAASLVFAHTILDDALSSFVEMTAEMAPAFWQKRVERKKIELAQLAANSQEELMDMVIRDELWRIKRNDSLSRKALLLHEICHLTPKARNAEYQWNIETLQQIDQTRQEIVHGDLLGKEIPETEKKLKYLQNTWYYFMFMMHEAFGLQLDADAMLNAAKRR
jgi:hypothetical protein